MITPTRVSILNDLLSSAAATKMGKHGEQLEVTCPVPALLSALVEAGIQSDLGRSLWPHVSNCPSCLDLYRRLSAFSQVESGDTSEPDRAWRSAGPRLEKAVRGLSYSESAKRATPKRWFAWLIRLPRSVQWALSCAAILLTGVASWSIYTSMGGEVDHPAQISRVPAVPRSTTPSIASNENPKPDRHVSLARTQDADAKSDFSVSRLFLVDAGTPIKLEIDSVQSDASAAFTIEGRLTPSSASATFEEVRFSGTLDHNLTKCDLSIKQITARGVSYEVPSNPVAVVTIDAINGVQPTAGQTLLAHLPTALKLDAVLR